MSLSESIIQKIHKDGPISFRDFMEMSLYYPGLGYYTSAKDKIGSQGDYYTSPVLTPIFGKMIGKQLEEMWYALGKEEFIIVEYGAGTGSLCYDILNRLKNNKELYDTLTYCIIEKSEVMRQKEYRYIGMHEKKVSWYNTIGDIPKITGCILSNEVIDNFPVHLVMMEDELMEVFIDYNNDFIELLKPASEELKNYLQEQNIILPKGYRTEINLQAIEWIKEIAAAIKKGFVLTIDYGYTSSELYRDNRSLGTLACYYRHTVNADPYNNVGEQDITTHANFSALAQWGFKNGLECCGFTNQAHFLRGLGLTDHLRKNENENDEADNNKKIFQMHTLLMDMGSKFKVLIQQKGLQQPRLSGMMFSQQITEQ